MTTEGDVERAPSKRSEDMDQALSLLLLQFLSPLHAFFGSSSLYSLGDDTLLDGSTVRSFQFSTLVLSLALA